MDYVVRHSLFLPTHPRCTDNKQLRHERKPENRTMWLLVCGYSMWWFLHRLTFNWLITSANFNTRFVPSVFKLTASLSGWSNLLREHKLSCNAYSKCNRNSNYYRTLAAQWNTTSTLAISCVRSAKSIPKPSSDTSPFTVLIFCNCLASDSRTFSKICNWRTFWNFSIKNVHLLTINKTCDNK